MHIIKKTAYFSLLFFSFLLISQYSFARDFGLSLGAGYGDPSSLRGGRIAGQLFWDKVWFKQSAINLTGYWDLSYAYWRTDGNSEGKNKSISIAAFAPVLRIQKAAPYSNTIRPYLDLSVGPALMSDDKVGSRDLGSKWTFQDFFGLGFSFGDNNQYDLSYRFIHYSNAGLSDPNDGIDVLAMLNFMYRF